MPLRIPSVLPAETEPPRRFSDVEGELPTATPLIHIDPETGIITTHTPDGGMEIDTKPESKEEDNKGDFDDNLAKDLDNGELMEIAERILTGIESDIQSSEDWRNTFNKGIALLGLKIEEASGEISGQTNVSKVYHPLLLEAVVRQQSNDIGEMLPSDGPVKVKDEDPEADMARFELAEDFERDFNHYLTSVDKTYTPDTDKMLFVRALCGVGFKKVYRDPILKRPVSRAVPPQNLIVSNDAISLSDATRITHEISMRRSTMKRMQLAGQYRDIDLQEPSDATNSVDEKIRTTEGLRAKTEINEDQRHTVYECYTELDLEEKGAPKGLPLPYRVSLDKDSRDILEIRRNWKEDDENYLPRRRFVKYGFVPGLGFYDYGLVHLLGNTSRALTAIERQLIDAGQFANFPAWLIAKQTQRQETNEIRLSPGGAMPIDTGGEPIQNAVMALPYKEPSAVLAKISETIALDGQRLGGTADINIGEGRADVPVGTTIALIEQATKTMSAVHKRSHAAQQEELELLKELFAEDPKALWKFAKKPNRKWEIAEEFNDINLVPASDPNVPSHIHRIMIATAIKQMASVPPVPGSIYDQRKVDSFVFKILGLNIGEELFAPPPPPGAGAPAGPPPDPAKMAKVQLDAQQQQREASQAVLEGNIRMQELAVESQDRAADRASREKVAGLKFQSEKLKAQQMMHTADQRHQETMGQAKSAHEQNLTKEAIKGVVTHHGNVLNAAVAHHANKSKEKLALSKPKEKTNGS